jgi:hypothetical protein
MMRMAPLRDSSHPAAVRTLTIEQSLSTAALLTAPSSWSPIRPAKHLSSEFSSVARPNGNGGADVRREAALNWSDRMFSRPVGTRSGR